MKLKDLFNKLFPQPPAINGVDLWKGKSKTPLTATDQDRCLHVKNEQDWQMLWSHYLKRPAPGPLPKGAMAIFYVEKLREHDLNNYIVVNGPTKLDGGQRDFYMTAEIKRTAGNKHRETERSAFWFVQLMKDNTGMVVAHGIPNVDIKTVKQFGKVKNSRPGKTPKSPKK